jgi:stage III sporulation protein AA
VEKMNAYRQITSKFPKEMANFMNRIPESVINEAEELRIRCGQNILLRLRNGEYQLDYRADTQLIQQILNNLIQYSYYAYEDDLASGFVTIEGGHRIGICGRTVIREGQPAMMKEISSLNIRFAREIPGCSRKVMPEILQGKKA